MQKSGAGDQDRGCRWAVFVMQMGKLDGRVFGIWKGGAEWQGLPRSWECTKEKRARARVCVCVPSAVRRCFCSDEIQCKPASVIAARCPGCCLFVT